MSTEASRGYRYYVRASEGVFERLSAAKTMDFIGGRLALTTADHDVRLVQVVIETEGRRVKSLVDMTFVRYRVTPDRRIRSRVFSDTVEAVFRDASKQGDLVHAEERFLQRARRWEPTAQELSVLIARAQRDCGLQASGLPRARKRPPLYVAHVEFRASLGKRLVEGALQLLVRGRKPSQVLAALRRALPVLRARHELPVEATYELMSVTELEEPIGLHRVAGRHIA